MRPLRFIAWGIVVAVIAHAAATYGALPDRIPTHLGLDGRPDRYAERSLLQWFALPVGALLLQVLFEVLARLLPSRPHLLNLPDKDRLLRLPARWRAPVMREAVLLLDVTAIGITALFGMIQWQLARVASGQPGGGGAVVLLAPIGLTVGLLLLVRRVTTAIATADEAWRAAGAPPE